jgi:hypothetical protein
VTGADTRGEPAELTAGDSWEWNRSVEGCAPSAGWALTYTLTGPAAPVTLSALLSPDGDFFEVRENAAAHEGLTAGNWKLTGKVSRGEARFTVYGPAPLLVRPNVEAVEGPDLSDTETRLNALRAVRDGRTDGIAEFTIGGRQVRYMTRSELNTEIAKLEIALHAARAPGPRGIAINFT